MSNVDSDRQTCFVPPGYALGPEQLLARCAWDAILRTFRALLGDPRLAPGAVPALQTFGAYAANFHPHVHALVTDGAVAPDGTFHELPGLDPRLLEELFRRLVLRRRHAAGRLSEEFRDNLLSWRRSGFSVGADQRIAAGDLPRLERLSRYFARGPLPLDRVRVESGQVLVTTPPDPRAGATELALDPLDFVHAITEQIPDPGQHLVRYYGWYASRTRGRRRAANQAAPAEPAAADAPRAPPALGRRQSPRPTLHWSVCMRVGLPAAAQVEAGTQGQDAPPDPRDRSLALSPLRRAARRLGRAAVNTLTGGRGRGARGPDREGRNHVLLASDAWISSPAPSPGGRRIAYAGLSIDDNLWRLERL